MAFEPTPLLSDEDRLAPRPLVEHALTLIGRAHRAAPDAAQAAEAELEAWRQASPAQAQAARLAERIWQATGTEGLGAQLPVPPSAAEYRARRRRVAGALGGLGVLGMAGAGGLWAWRRPVYEAALRTGHAQTLAHGLPDGSRIDLSPHTAAQAVFYRGRRLVRLEQGEAQFSVARDAARPFQIDTAWGRVRVLGTVFTVSARNGRMRVAVARGRVEVWTAGNDAASLTLRAGEAVEAGTGGMGAPAAVDVAEIADWQQGWLVFRDTPLPDAVARWNDYLSRPLRLAAGDQALRALRVTGSYRLDDPRSFLGSLAHMLPLTTRDVEGGIEIASRR